ncbi:MAG: cytochrome C oxidase subunit IV family protein [Hahellaceae bacterium]|jgi:cytochrome c oxidase subunit IV|nr:cytochrome C oxidase subunit IV family protein [Hahellaceae bacterium]MCP5211678.1 cytochrome C oxidase subunit IV family protein [Hahellaceae bacterium]
MSLANRSTLIWLFLIALTCIAAYVGEFSTTNPQIIGFIILALIIKAQLVVDYFMGLRHVKTVWRLILSAFSIVIGTIIFITYMKGL